MAKHVVELVYNDETKQLDLNIETKSPAIALQMIKAATEKIVEDLKIEEEKGDILVPDKEIITP